MVNAKHLMNANEMKPADKWFFMVNYSNNWEEDQEKEFLRWNQGVVGEEYKLSILLFTSSFGSARAFIMQHYAQVSPVYSSVYSN